jgi:hypothetical protein
MYPKVPEPNTEKSWQSTIKWDFPPSLSKLHDSLSVTFNTESDYNNAIENPYSFVVDADRQDVKNIYMSVRGDRKPRIMLRVKSVLRLGHRAGVL